MITFKENHTIKVMLNKSLRGKAPESWSTGDWAEYYRHFQQEELTPRDLAYEIYQGYSFTPLYKNGRRKIENFVEAHHIAFDFDTDGASLDHLMRDESLAWYFSSFAYSTPSSTESHPKTRVVFVFDHPVQSVDRFKEIYISLAWHFAQDGSICDPQCKDPLRLYYGSPGAKMVGNWSILTDVICQEYIDLYNVKAIKEPPKKEKIIIPQDKGGDMASIYIERLANNVRMAPQGERHAARINNGRAAGGYIAAGYIDQSSVENVMLSAAAANTDTPEKAQKEMMESIIFGMNDPLYIEVNEVASIEELIL